MYVFLKDTNKMLHQCSKKVKKTNSPCKKYEYDKYRSQKKNQFHIWLAASDCRLIMQLYIVQAVKQYVFVIWLTQYVNFCKQLCRLKISFNFIKKTNVYFYFVNMLSFVTFAESITIII